MVGVFFSFQRALVILKNAGPQQHHTQERFNPARTLPPASVMQPFLTDAGSCSGRFELLMVDFWYDIERDNTLISKETQRERKATHDDHNLSMQHLDGMFLDRGRSTLDKSR